MARQMSNMILIIKAAAALYGIPGDIMVGLCSVESSLNPDAYVKHDGGSPSYGLCQIKLETARGLGFKGTKDDLMDPKINAHFAVRYVSEQLLRYDNNLTKAIAAYNQGHWVKSRPNKGYTTKVYERAVEINGSH